ncbi:MAG TPA: energy-coupling factor transporter transmembrane protein EcfT [Candidatus Latescibacteria bacterium]|nr:energy-coupling factor transporter transmembrane protein EcfT [Candidatus Latescibacterota bacterium]
MLKDVTIGQYVARDSLIHRLDPRTKLISLSVLVVAVFVADALSFHLILVVYIGIAVLLSKLPVLLVLKNIRPFLWLMVLTLGLHGLFTTEGTLIFSIAWLNVTSEGLTRGLFFSYRLAVLISSTALLMLTTSPMDLIDALEHLLRPLRKVGVPVHELAMMTGIALRFIPALVDEADRLRKAQLARGADFGGGIVRKTRNLLPLVVPLFLSSFRRADRLAVAMEARCYRGGEERTNFRELGFRRADGLALAVVFLVTLVGLLLNTLELTV